MKPILHEGYLWCVPVNDGGGWLIHCVPVASQTSNPPMYASEAAAFEDITLAGPGQPADWSKDL